MFLCLALHGKDGAGITVAISTISKETGYSETTVGSALSKLTEMGYLETAARFDEDGRQTSNAYSLRGFLPQDQKLGGGGSKTDTHQGVLKVTPKYIPLEVECPVSNETAAEPAQADPEPSPPLVDPTPVVGETKAKRRKTGVLPDKRSVPADSPSSGQAASRAMFAALAEVCRVNVQIKRGQLQQTERRLRAIGATPEEVRRLYGQGSVWYKMHWKGKKGEPPGIEDVCTWWEQAHGGQTVEATNGKTSRWAEGS